MKEGEEEHKENDCIVGESHSQTLQHRSQESQDQGKEYKDAHVSEHVAHA